MQHLTADICVMTQAGSAKRATPMEHLMPSSNNHTAYFVTLDLKSIKKSLCMLSLGSNSALTGGTMHAIDRFGLTGFPSAR